MINKTTSAALKILPKKEVSKGKERQQDEIIHFLLNLWMQNGKYIRHYID